MRKVALLVALLALAGCSNDSRNVVVSASTAGGSTPSPSGNTAPVVSAQNPTPGSATNATQWQTALAALAAGPAPDPLDFDAASVAAYNALIRQAWPTLVPRLQAEVETQLRTQIGQALQGISLLSIRAITLDAAAPPALGASAPGPFQTVEIHLPQSGTWALRIEAEIGGTIPINVFGLSTGATFAIPIEVAVTDLNVFQAIDLDLTNPVAPQVGPIGQPRVQLQLSITSSAPILNAITGFVTQLLDPIVRGALSIGAVFAQQQLGIVVRNMPNGGAWGRGGPALQGMANPPALEPVALDLMRQITADHMPHGMVYPAVFDQPVGGSVSGYRHFGDSALWTGGFLASEAYRFDLTGDPQAMVTARKIVDAYNIATRMTAPGDGLLARTAIPVTSPYHAAMVNNHSYYTGDLNGVTYGAVGDTSRDSYTGTMLGLGQAYHRFPQLRGDIAPLLTRLINYLDTHGWTVFKAPNQLNNPSGQDMSVTFAQSPAASLAFATVGNMADPVRWGPLQQRFAPLAGALWLPAWVSSQEIHEGYFKFNLGHMNLLSLFELDADPDRYRDYLRTLRIFREVVGHHQNPWFDAVYATAIPSASPQVGADVKTALELWTLRPRRHFTIQNSTDPTIQTTTYVATLPNATGSPSSPLQTGPRPQDVAVYPVPIEKRPSSAFIWSSSPFDLDSHGDPREQHPGNDLVIPYWLARNHGVIR